MRWDICDTWRDGDSQAFGCTWLCVPTWLSSGAQLGFALHFLWTKSCISEHEIHITAQIVP